MSSGGNNIFILKIDKNNTTGNITVTTELTSDIITLSIDEPNELNEKLKVYPTLVSNLVNIEGLQGVFTVQVFDLSGRLILQTNNSKIIDMSEINSGLYIIKITQGDFNKQVKIIKS